MPRERLPDRRQAETVDLWHGGQRFHVTIGQYPDGRPGEVFIHGAKPGSDTVLLCDDIGGGPSASPEDQPDFRHFKKRYFQKNGEIFFPCRMWRFRGGGAYTVTQE